MELVKFMNAHKKDWQMILSAEPYNIKITSAPAINGYYYLLKYNQLSSNFNLGFCREARGCIMYYDNLADCYECVCHPFDKFGNYGESYVPEIDWKSARVTEKVDGSLIKVWYHGGWHISTNGTIDARTAYLQNGSMSYYDLFLRAIRKYGTVEGFFKALDFRYTYLFELVSPDNRMTIYYPEDAIYLIGKRNNLSHVETKITPFIKTTFDIYYSSLGVQIPCAYSFASLEDCIAATKLMGADKEGFVVCDKNFNRVKVKSPEYLIASHLRFNNSITVKKIIKIAREGCLDDFLAYSSDYADIVKRVLDIGRCYAANMEADWRMLSKLNILSKKDFYQAVKHSPYCDFLCKKYDAKYSITAAEWLGQLPLDKIAEIIEEELEIDGRGEEEYE